MNSLPNLKPKTSPSLLHLRMRSSLFPIHSPFSGSCHILNYKLIIIFLTFPIAFVCIRAGQGRLGHMQ